MSPRKSLFAAVGVSMVLVTGCGGAIETTSVGGPSPEPTGSSSPPPSPTGSMSPPAPSGSGTTQENPPPTAGGTWNATASGCGEIFVFDGHSSGKKFLVISADNRRLNLAKLGDEATIDLRSRAPAVSLTVDTYPTTPHSTYYCSDIVEPRVVPPSIAGAIEGKVKIRVSAQVDDSANYAVDVSLEGVVVRAPNGTREAVSDITFVRVVVGWYAG